MISHERPQGVDLKEKEEVLRNNQELNMPITEIPSRIAQLKNECRTE